MPHIARKKSNGSSEAASQPTNGSPAENSSKSKRRASGRKSSAPKKAPKRARKPATPARGRGKHYTDAERAKILETAKREGLTGNQVKERFGVSTLTYYLWRKKSKARAGRPVGRPRLQQLHGLGLETLVREAVRARIQEIMPRLIQKEAASFIAARIKSR